MLWSTRDMMFSSKTKRTSDYSDLFRSSHDCKCAAHDWLATATTLVHWEWQASFDSFLLLSLSLAATFIIIINLQTPLCFSSSPAIITSSFFPLPQTTYHFYSQWPRTVSQMVCLFTLQEDSQHISQQPCFQTFPSASYKTLDTDIGLR